MSAAKQLCCRLVGHGWHSSQCRRGAKYERDGKWYCGTHDPVAVEAKREAKAAEWNRKFDARQADSAKEATELREKNRRAACFPELLEALELVVDKLGSDFELYREQQFAIDTARAAIAKANGSTT